MKGLNTSKDAGKLVKSTKLNRTACVRLVVSPEDSVKLLETHALYRDACNFVVPFVCKNKESRLWQRFALHKAVYSKIRETFPALGAQLACNVIRSVSSAYKTELANHPQQLQQSELKAIRFKNPSVHLDKNTITYRDNHSQSLHAERTCGGGVGAGRSSAFVARFWQTQGKQSRAAPWLRKTPGFLGTAHYSRK